MPQIVSTLSTGMDYTIYAENLHGGANTVVKIITIKGGAGVARRGGDTGIFTPEGQTTEVSDEDLAYLKSNPVFQTHVDHGYVQILVSAAKIEKAVKDMSKKDASAPLVDEDFKQGGRGAGDAPKVGKLE